MIVSVNVAVKSTNTRTRIQARRLSAPFDDAQGNRRMGLFQQRANLRPGRRLDDGLNDPFEIRRRIVLNLYFAFARSRLGNQAHARA